VRTERKWVVTKKGRGIKGRLLAFHGGMLDDADSVLALIKRAGEEGLDTAEIRHRLLVSQSGNPELANVALRRLRRQGLVVSSAGETLPRASMPRVSRRNPRITPKTPRLRR